MKCAVVITDSKQQIVLTPESPAEKAIIELIKVHSSAKILHGGYTLDDCQGGWVRPFEDKSSIMLVIGDDSGQ